MNSYIHFIYKIFIIDCEFLWSFHMWILMCINSCIWIHTWIHVDYKFIWSFHTWICMFHEFRYQILGTKVPDGSGDLGSDSDVPLVSYQVLHILVPILLDLCNITHCNAVLCNVLIMLHYIIIYQSSLSNIGICQLIVCYFIKHISYIV